MQNVIRFCVCVCVFWWVLYDLETLIFVLLSIIRQCVKVFFVDLLSKQSFPCAERLKKSQLAISIGFCAFHLKSVKLQLCCWLLILHEIYFCMRVTALAQIVYIIRVHTGASVSHISTVDNDALTITTNDTIYFLVILRHY